MAMLLGFLALCAGWLAPNHYVPWLAFQQECIAAVGTILIGVGAVTAAGANGILWPRLSLLAIAVAITPLLQFAFGQIAFFSDAVLASLYIAGFSLSMVTAATLMGTGRKQEFLAGLFAAFLVAAIVSTGMAAVQWSQIGPVGYIGDLAPGKRPYANLAQPNHVATLLALGLTATVWFFETRRIGSLTASLLVAWLGLGLTMTQSRTGWLFVVALGVSALLMRRRTPVRTHPAAILSSLAIFVLLQLLWQPLSEALLLTSESFSSRAQSSLRLLVWPGLVDAVGASPWTGYGWRQVSIALYEAADDHVMQHGLFVNSHNLILDLLIWNGIPLGLLIIGALAWWFARQVFLSRSVERWLLLAGVAAIFLHAMFEYPLEYAYFLFPAGLMMGALDGPEASRSKLRTPRLALAAPLLASTAMVGWISIEYLAVEESSRQARMVMAGIGVDKMPTAPLPQVRLLDGPREFQRFWSTRARPGMTADELHWMRDVMRRNPSPPTMLRYSLAVGLNGRSEEALATLNRLCHIHPMPRCKEAQDAWGLLRDRYPQLAPLAFPQKAARLLTKEPA